MRWFGPFDNQHAYCGFTTLGLRWDAQHYAANKDPWSLEVEVFGSTQTLNGGERFQDEAQAKQYAEAWARQAIADMQRELDAVQEAPQQQG